MKYKWLFVAMISALMAVGLVLASCGSKCPGGASSGGAGNCKIEFDTDKGLFDARGCTNTGGCVYKAASEGKESASCDCS